MPDSQKFYLTTPIYYVNARPHIGHAYTTLVADTVARRHRLLGHDTFFLTGTDEHGQKIERSATAAGINPQQFSDEVSTAFRTLWDRMGLTYDGFIRTTEPRHQRGAQKLFADLHARGQIYLSSYTGQYSVGEEMFVEGPPGTIGPDGRPTETVTEENFFFKLSEYQARLIDLIESNELSIQPETRKNEVLSFLRGNVAEAIRNDQVEGELSTLSDTTAWTALEGPSAASTHISSIAYSKLGTPYVPGALRDLSVSRSSFTWGIPVPEPAASQTKQKHVIYVWLDALANYMTALGYGSEDESNFKKFWPADLHLVGKEIIRFHCVYWPAFLMAAGLPLPKAVTAHGWLLFDDAKMSKSKGNIVRTETILDAFGTLCPPVPTLPHTKGTGFSPSVTEPNENAALAAEGTPATTAETTAPTDAPPATSPLSSASHGPSASHVSSALPLLSSRSNAEGSAFPEPPRPPTKAEQDLFATDVLRYFLLREIPFGSDGSFNFDAMITRYNADLANGYGNLVSRTLNLISQNFSTGESVSGRPIGSSRIPPLSVGNDEKVENYSTDLISQSKSLIEFLNTEANEIFFTGQLQRITEHIQKVDQFLTTEKPWAIASELKASVDVYVTPESQHEAESNLKELGVRLESVLYTAAESIRIITALLYPILPTATAKVWLQLGLGDIELASDNGELRTLTWGGLKPGTKLGPLAPIFPRADKGLAQIMIDIEAAKATAAKPANLTDEAAPTAPEQHDSNHPAAAPRALDIPNPGATVGGSHAVTTERIHTPHGDAPASGPFAASALGSTTPDTPQIAIDDFVKIDLRVAQILVAERIPKADKLLRLEVDLGYEKRQILSGIAQWYTPEELIGRRIVVIANLAPRKMRGLESHGMLLAASEGEDGKPVLATFGEDVALGSRLK